MKDYSFLKEKYRIMERNVLILIILPLPFFALVYLNMTRPVRSIPVPDLPVFVESFLLSLTFVLLIYQQINFQRSIRSLQETGISFEDKVLGYIRASTIRYAILAVVGFAAAFGLLFFANIGFTIAYAIALLLVSVLKPSPVRMLKLFQFDEEEKQFVRLINKEFH